MKKFSLLFIAIIAVTAFGFVSYNSVDNAKPTSTLHKIDNLTVIKGAEKSGLAQSNENW